MTIPTPRLITMPEGKTLESLRLVAKHQGHQVPTVGGMLLFGKDREMIFPDAWIQCGRFIGTDKADIFDHIDIHDHLPIAVERVMEFLKKHAMRVVRTSPNCGARMCGASP